MFGLFSSAEGSASPHSAGVITALAQQASQLSPEQSTSPVVCLESDKGYSTIPSCLSIILNTFHFMGLSSLRKLLKVQVS